MTSGAAETTLQTLQDILHEIAESAEKQGISTSVDKIISNVKSTMSDRASTQKSFNTLLSEYRAGILPIVIQDWDDFIPEEKQSMSQMHNFFCGMHLVVNMAEHASECLKLIERNYPNNPKFAFNNDSESGTLRLIRTTCKAFEKRGNEKSGCPLQFTSYLKRNGIAKNPLIHFRGNRFNIIFANGARVYSLHNHITDFLKNVWGTPNHLLKAVLEDATNDNYIAGCKALGLIDKLITGPLWRILESDIHILDIPEYYTKLRIFFKETTAQNINSVMIGERIPFTPDLIKRDEIWETLSSQSHHDSSVEYILLSLFKSFELLLERVLADHQPVMSAAAENKEKVKSETTTVKTTNTISERDFGKLDRLIREKPNASILALEAHILFTNNKTTKWLATKSSDERRIMFEEARKNAPQHRQRYHEHLSNIEKERIKVQNKKQKEKEASERKRVQMKEKITSELTDYGLWISPAQVKSKLSAMRSEKQKCTALKAQLRFRKTVLQQQPTDDSVYKFSSKEKGHFDSQLLCENLLKLIEYSRSIEASESATPESIPSLSGKYIEHNFTEPDGTIKPYKGKVISQVPGFLDWYNVVYTEEPGIVYTFKLKEDFDNGDLKIL